MGNELSLTPRKVLEKENCPCANTAYPADEREVSRMIGNNFDILTIERDIRCDKCDKVIAVERTVEREDKCATTHNQED